MKKYFNSYVMAMLAMVLGFGFTTKAQDTSEPVIVIHTNAYANNGEINVFDGFGEQ